MTTLDVAIIGAGPYGLAAGAYLRRVKGLDVRIFGEPMSFWREHMPRGMLLRSSWSASHIADPGSALSLDAYKLTSGNHLAAPVPLERFVEYGLWFQRTAVPDLDSRRISRIESIAGRFRLTIDGRETLQSRRVIIAAGISSFAARPVEFDRVPASLASHTSEHPDLARFAGKDIVVIGSGQSALESAALLHEHGARVEIIMRKSRVHWLGWKEKLQSVGPLGALLYSPADVGPAGISRLVAAPDVFNKLPRRLQDDLRTLSIRPAGARWLPGRLKDVRFTLATRVLRATYVGERVQLTLDDQTQRVADHVMLGTGYRVNISRYAFLSQELLNRVRLVNGFPVLGRGFEASVPGLHFLGACAAWSYGPLMCFVSGTKYAGETLFRHLSTTKNPCA